MYECLGSNQSIMLIKNGTIYFVLWIWFLVFLIFVRFHWFMNMFDFARIINAKTKLVYNMQHFFSLKIVYRPHNYLQSGAYVSLSFLNFLNNLKQCILTKIREVDQLPFMKLCKFEMLSKLQYNNHTYTNIVIRIYT